jgi:alpha-galactosidase
MAREKLVLIGAGSTQFTRGLVAALLRTDQAAEIALVDLDPEALEVAERLTRRMAASRGSSLRVSASVDRRDVLSGSTVVISTIHVGGRKAWVQDVEICRRYGIFVPVGDTVGPAGSSRVLRTVPSLVGIAEDVLDLAPGALFFNHTNPLGPAVRAVRKATGANVIGLCHGVHSTAEYLADKLGVAHDRLAYTAVGRNHLTWITDVRVDGSDAMAGLRDIAEREATPLLTPDAHSTEVVDTPVREQINAFSWRLFLAFGAWPAPGDRHITEYFPQFFRYGEYFGMKLGVHRAAFSFENRIASGDRIYREMRRDASSPGALEDDYFEGLGADEAIVLDIVDSIRNDGGRVYSANLPNSGAIPGVPDEAIVEAPAIAGRTGMHLIPQAALAAPLLGTLSDWWQWDETIVDAALEGSRDRFVQALVLDGHVDSLSAAGSLADELLAAQAAFLPWVRSSDTRGSTVAKLAP